MKRGTKWGKEELRRVFNNRLRRQQAKRQAVFIILCCMLMTILVVLVFTITPSVPPDQEKAEKKVSAMSESEEQTGAAVEGIRTENTPSLSLGLGGDVCFGLSLSDIIDEEGPAYPWGDITPVLKDYDLTAFNLEGPICRGNEPNKDQPLVLLRGDASCIQIGRAHV